MSPSVATIRTQPRPVAGNPPQYVIPGSTYCRSVQLDDGDLAVGFIDAPLQAALVYVEAAGAGTASGDHVLPAGRAGTPLDGAVCRPQPRWRAMARSPLPSLNRPGPGRDGRTSAQPVDRQAKRVSAARRPRPRRSSPRRPPGPAAVPWSAGSRGVRRRTFRQPGRGSAASDACLRSGVRTGRRAWRPPRRRRRGHGRSPRLPGGSPATLPRTPLRVPSGRRGAGGVHRPDHCGVRVAAPLDAIGVRAPAPPEDEFHLPLGYLLPPMSPSAYTPQDGSMPSLPPNCALALGG